MSVSHGWTELVEAAQQQVKTRSVELKKELKRFGVFYLNARAEIVAPHTVEVNTYKHMQILDQGHTATPVPFSSFGMIEHL